MRRVLLKSRTSELYKSYILSLCCLISTFIACEIQSTPTIHSEDTGKISVEFRLGKLAQDSITRAEIVISGSGMDDIQQELTVDGNSITGLVRDIPAGSNRQFTVNGFDASGTLTYTGSSTAEVIPGEEVIVRITLRRLTSDPDSIAESPSLGFNGSGNGTTGVITLSRGINTIRVNKEEGDSVTLRLLDATTGEEVLFNFLSLMSLEGRGQTSIAKSFVIRNDGEYIINIEGSSGLGNWGILIGPDQVATRTIIASGIIFEGRGNGTTGIISLNQGAHVVQIEKESSDSITLRLLDATTGEEVLFNFLSLMSLEGRGQTSIAKSFVITSGGEFIFNIEGSSDLDDWKMTIR